MCNGRFISIQRVHISFIYLFVFFSQLNVAHSCKQVSGLHSSQWGLGRNFACRKLYKMVMTANNHWEPNTKHIERESLNYFPPRAFHQWTVSLLLHNYIDMRIHDSSLSKTTMVHNIWEKCNQCVLISH